MNKQFNKRMNKRTNERRNEYLKDENTRRPLTPLIDSNNKQNSANIVNNNRPYDYKDSWSKTDDEIARHVKERFGFQEHYSK